MRSRFFLKTIQIRLLAPHAIDIAVITMYLITHCFTMFHIFLSSQVVHWSAEIQTNVYDPRKEGVTDRSTKRVNSRSLT